MAYQHCESHLGTGSVDCFWEAVESNLKNRNIHCSPLITPCLGSIGMNSIISEWCYKETVFQRNYRKMTIFSINSFIKFHG